MCIQLDDLSSLQHRYATILSGSQLTDWGVVVFMFKVDAEIQQYENNVLILAEYFKIIL